MKVLCPFCQAAGKIGDQWQGKDVRCPACQKVFRPGQSEATVTWTEPVAEPEPQVIRYRVLFTGESAELWQLWWRDLLFALVTFGLYLPWARARINSFLLAHTVLNGSNFHCRADTFARWPGYWLLGGCFVAYLLSCTVGAFYASLLLVMLALILPFALYRYHHHLVNSLRYGDARFSFHGTMAESYLVYLWIPLLTIISLGLLLPYWAYRHKLYLWGNISLAGRRNEWVGKVSYFYNIFLRGLWLTLAIILPLAVLFVALGFAQEDLFGSGPAGPAMAESLLAFIVFCYLGLGLAGIVGWQYIFARLENYCRQNCQLGQINFLSSLRPVELMWLCFSNLLAVTCSLGALYPWARIRRTRYLLAHLQVQPNGDPLFGHDASNGQGLSGKTN